MATLRTQTKFAAVATESQDEHRRNDLSRDTAVPGIREVYNIQVSVESEGRMTRNCLESSKGQRIEFCVLCPS